MPVFKGEMKTKPIKENLLIVWVVSLLVIVFVAAAGCGSGQSVDGIDLSVTEAQRLWQKNEAVLIDVRTPEEYREGHIPGVVNIPLDELEKRMHEIPRDKKVVLVCRTANRSAQGTKLLRNKGFTNVFNSTGGMSTGKGPVTK